MTLFAELSGVQVVTGKIVIPLLGAWHSDVELVKETALATSGLALVLGKLRMTCAPWRTPIAFQGKTHVRLIGGRGGWRNVVPAQGYSSPAGVRLSLVLGAIAKACGETLAIGAGLDRVVGKHYTRETGAGSTHLNTLCPSSWYIDADGITRIGPRASTPITSAFTIVDYNGARGSMTIATDFPEDIIPGRTLKGTTIAKSITVGGVTHTITAGKVRTEILAA